MLHNFKFHNNLKCKLFLLITGLNISFCMQAKCFVQSPTDSIQTLHADSISSSIDTLKVSVPKENPNKIDAEISYSAADSIVFYGNGTGFLHGKGDVKYKTLLFKPILFVLRWTAVWFIARGETDSLGNKIGELEPGRRSNS